MLLIPLPVPAPVRGPLTLTRPAAARGIHARRDADLSARTAVTRARQALDRVGVAHLADRGVADMSGGERARVLLDDLDRVGVGLRGADPDVAGAGPRNRGPVLTGLLLALGPALFCLVYFGPGRTGLDDAPRAVFE